jgi:hypothetical protein
MCTPCALVQRNLKPGGLLVTLDNGHRAGAAAGRGAVRGMAGGCSRAPAAGRCALRIWRSGHGLSPPAGRRGARIDDLL